MIKNALSAFTYVDVRKFGDDQHCMWQSVLMFVCPVRTFFLSGSPNPKLVIVLSTMEVLPYWLTIWVYTLQGAALVSKRNDHITKRSLNYFSKR